jgi:hypothetical protein
MEEILASIRRIIADDQDGVRVAPVPFTQPAPAEDDHGPAVAELRPRRVNLADVEPEPEEELLEDVEEPAEPEAALPDDEPVPAPFEPPAVARVSEPPAAPATPGPLLSEAAQTTAASAFQRLSAAVEHSQPRTFEDHVKEMLRPMLKAWLDENLPPLVERLVQAEIERVSRGR